MAGAEQTLQLGHGVALTCSFPGTTGSVRVRLSWSGHDLFDSTVSETRPRAELAIDQTTFRADGLVQLDLFAGELRLAAHLAVRDRTAQGSMPQPWKPILDPDRTIVVRFDPCIGMVGGSPVVHAPVVDDPVFGRSQLCTPVVLRIHVEDEDRRLAEVGRVVKHELFRDVPAFTFNTVACVGAAPDGAPGAYTDPESVWFNVFFGFYQLDCPKSLWHRPFGYSAAAGRASKPLPEEVVRLGNADWNWFSNWMYGVPETVLYPYSTIPMNLIGVTVAAPHLIGASWWHHIRLSGVQVASSYESARRGAGRLERNTILQPVWRHAFGLPHPRPGHPDSFVPTHVDAALDMAYWEDDAAFHTVMFGATAGTGTDPAFLAAQIAATRTIIEQDYPALGFT